MCSWYVASSCWKLHVAITNVWNNFVCNTVDRGNHDGLRAAIRSTGNWSFSFLLWWKTRHPNTRAWAREHLAPDVRPRDGGSPEEPDEGTEKVSTVALNNMSELITSWSTSYLVPSLNRQCELTRESTAVCLARRKDLIYSNSLFSSYALCKCFVKLQVTISAADSALDLLLALPQWALNKETGLPCSI